MVEMNPQNSQLSKASGIIAVETQSGHQSWALIVDVQIRYDNDVTVSYGDSPQYSVIATLPPGEKLRVADTIEAGEENVLVYSRLLVAVLREERDRYAELEKRFFEQSVQLRKAREEAGNLERDRDEMLHAAWRDGASIGWMMHDLPPHVMLSKNPHPEPEPEEEEGCHVCGGADH